MRAASNGNLTSSVQLGESVITVFVVLHILTALFTVLGNAFLIYLVITDKRLRTPNNLYVVSMALGGIASGCAAVPANLAIRLTDDTLGSFCKLWQFFIHVIEASFGYTIVAMATDKFRRFTVTTIIKLSRVEVVKNISIIWAFSILYGLKEPALHHSEGRTYVDETYQISAYTCSVPIKRREIRIMSRSFVVIDFIILYLLPLGLVTCFYIKTIRRMSFYGDITTMRYRRRSVFFHIAQAAQFFLCILGIHIISLVKHRGPLEYSGQYIVEETVKLLFVGNFLLNALMYIMANSRFRSAAINRWKQSFSERMLEHKKGGGLANCTCGSAEELALPNHLPISPT